MKLKITKCENLSGTVNISGSKNVTLPIIAAALLSKKKVILRNIPLITDVLLMIEIIKSMGVYVKREKHRLVIKAKSFNPMIDSKDVTKFRGSYYLIGACLARYNMCSIKCPGGCNFSKRPIDMHIKAFEELGFKIDKYNEVLYIKKEQETKSEIVFDKKSLGTTINTIIASSLLNKPIKLINISIEPEVLETIIFLKKLGINIIQKNDNLYIFKNEIKRNIHFKIISDRIEAGSYMLLASAFKNSEVIIKNAPTKYLESVIKTLEDLGSNIEIKENNIIVKGKSVKALNLEINEYPSFPTDLQPILSTILLRGNNESTIKDNIYPKRSSHISELTKMNAKIRNYKDKIIIYKSDLIGTRVSAKDLRMAFGLVIAGCIASGETIIENAEILLRGYEQPILKLKKIGVKLTEYIS